MRTVRLSFQQPYLDALASEYGAGMNLVDYEKDPDGARQRINAWVDTSTHQRIPELIPAGAIQALTRLVLVNAIYLKAKWAAQFKPELTSDADFTTLAGRRITVTSRPRLNSPSSSLSWVSRSPLTGTTPTSPASLPRNGCSST